MPVSDAAINALPLGKDLYGHIRDCFLNWQQAACNAIFTAPDPQDSGATMEWWIALVGNMVWAATVFFPPSFVAAGVVEATVTAEAVASTATATVRTASVVASASAATKAASLVGAAVGSGVVVQLRSYGRNLKTDGKGYIRQYVLSQIPAIQSAYVAGADEIWGREVLNHLLSMAGLAKHERGGSYDLSDADFTSYYNSARGAEECARCVWEDHIFPGYLTTYDRGQLGLEDFFARQLKVALQQFDDQWDDYKREASRNFKSVRDYLKADPFVPDLTFPGLPANLNMVSQQRHRIRIRTGPPGRLDTKFH